MERTEQPSPVSVGGGNRFLPASSPLSAHSPCLSSGPSTYPTTIIALQPVTTSGYQMSSFKSLSAESCWELFAVGQYRPVSGPARSPQWCVEIFKVLIQLLYLLRIIEISESKIVQIIFQRSLDSSRLMSQLNASNVITFTYQMRGWALSKEYK